MLKFLCIWLIWNVTIGNWFSRNFTLDTDRFFICNKWRTRIGSENVYAIGEMQNVAYNHHWSTTPADTTPTDSNNKKAPVYTYTISPNTYTYFIMYQLQRLSGIICCLEYRRLTAFAFFYHTYTHTWCDMCIDWMLVFFYLCIIALLHVYTYILFEFISLCVCVFYCPTFEMIRMRIRILWCSNSSWSLFGRQ